MAQASSQDREKGEKSSLVSIGTHKLYVSVAGPDRKKDEPVIVLMQGLGATIAEWVALRRLVTPFARFICYDRSGAGKSESNPEPPEAITAVAIAHELDTLLKKHKCGNPIHRGMPFLGWHFSPRISSFTERRSGGHGFRRCQPGDNI